MIYMTGDTHGEFRRFSWRNFPQQGEMSKEDYVVIAGDFGGVWFGKDDVENLKSERYQLDELNDRSFTTLFIPGNHENYARLMSDEFPQMRWHGGLVKQIRPSVLMLMRGEMFELDGVRIFAFGGAKSHDVQDGILDGTDPYWREKARRLRERKKFCFRIKGVSWWEEELPSEEEMQHGLDTLDQNGWKCDYVITHCAPTSTQCLMGMGEDRRDALTDYLDEIRARLDYRNWYFGHYHANLQINREERMLYEEIIRIH